MRDRLLVAGVVFWLVIVWAVGWPSLRLPGGEFGFAGGLLDNDTGLVHFGAREYDPKIGRFITKEPPFAGGVTNLYEYALNDPINWIDTDGFAAKQAQDGGGMSVSAEALFMRAGSISTNMNGGKNSVRIQTPTGEFRVDLQGRAHNGIETPHVQISSRHFNPSDPSLSRLRLDVTRPATVQDLRLIERYLQNQNSCPGGGQ